MQNLCHEFSDKKWNMQIYFCFSGPKDLILNGTELLNVDSLHHLLAVGDGGLLECLTATQFLYNAGLFKFAFEFLECSFDELAFFYLYYYHIILLIYFVFAYFSAAKLVIFLYLTKLST